jgi:hypothetical protein
MQSRIKGQLAVCRGKLFSSKAGQYIVTGLQGHSKNNVVVYISTNETVGTFDTRKEAEDQANIWNKEKLITGKRPI